MGCQCSKASPVVATSDKGFAADSDIRATYRLGPILGSGSFGQVRVCLHRQSEKQYACKIMTKNSQRTRKNGTQSVDFVNMFRNEIDILRSIEHPHVVRLVNVYEDRHFLYAVMEKCEGGELFTKIVQRRKFSEQDASRLCRDMLSAIAYVHKLGIVHRDIKAENFLFSHKLPGGSNAPGSILAGMNLASRLVLIDFGMSVQLNEADRFLRQVCGSPHYVAPELIKRRYRQEVDLWALGVIVFLMLYGRYPFEGSDQKQIAQRILKNEPDYLRSSTKPSTRAIDFIKGLLEKDPTKRLTPEQAFRHEWILTNGVVSDSSIPQAISRSSSLQSAAEPPLRTDERMVSQPLKLSEQSEDELAASLSLNGNEGSLLFAEGDGDGGGSDSSCVPQADDEEDEDEDDDEEEANQEEQEEVEEKSMDSRVWDSESGSFDASRPVQRRATASTIGSNQNRSPESVAARRLKLREAAAKAQNMRGQISPGRAKSTASKGRFGRPVTGLAESD